MKRFPRSLLRHGCALGLLLAAGLRAEPAPANHDEAKVPAYTLPDPLVAADGSPVRDAAGWRARRAELLELFAAQMYGRTPAAPPAGLHWETTSVDRAALGGRATRKQVTVWFTAERSGPQMHLLIYQPNPPSDGTTGTAPRRWPVFLGLNFFGNHTVHADPGIDLARPFTVYDVARYRPATPVPTPAPEQRGTDAAKWQIETVLARGYATATVYRDDLCPDRADGLREGAAAAFATGGAEERAEDAWGAVGAWAWGLSRALDVIAADPELDAGRVAVHGFSRLGKAADWAAAQDERFALLVSLQSGCGGAALSKRLYGETVAIINKNFPHWFARSFRRYNDNESALPFDQHELLALLAPRPVLVTSAEGDRWSDPRGEFLSAKHASPVWRLFGVPGLDADDLPPVGQAVGDRVAYYVRAGKHDVTAEDWAHALDFADRRLAPSGR